MSSYIRAKTIESEIAQLQKELDVLKASEEYTATQEFENALRDLLSRYGKSLNDIMGILAPERAAATKAQDKGVRRPRAPKRYKNPHNGEVVETKGGNHKILKEWKAQWGADTVEGWLES